MKDQRKGAQEPRVIRNRDVILLSRVLYIMQDVCSLEKRMIWQYERMFGTTARITGMPGGKGKPSGFDAAFAAISGLNEDHKAQVQSCRKDYQQHTQPDDAYICCDAICG